MLAALVLAASPALATMRSASSDVVPDSIETTRMPRSDFDLGLRIAMEVRAEIGFVDDDSLNARLRDIGYRVASVVPEPALFSFHIVDLPYPNAFAVPGGFVFVTKGMMEMNLTDAELAALLGHEIGHVVGGHFARSKRLSSILSLAEIALLVGVLVAGGESSQAPRYEVEDGAVYRGSTGRDALIQGVPTFGGFFRTLIERKYGRNLEFEADAFGARCAAAAGFGPNAAEDMLRLFRSRIHEDTQYGYWLTHPFFSERLTRAAVLSRTLDAPLDAPADYSYRRHVQRELVRIASQREDEVEAAFLYHLALEADAYGHTALEAGQEILRFRTRRNAKKDALLRESWPIVADYDSLLALGRRMEADPSLVASLQAERDSVDAARAHTLPEFLERLDREVRATSLLERFVRNYPDHERRAEMQFQLAENYRRSGRPDRAAETLLVIAAETDSTWRGKSLATLAEILGQIEGAVTMQEVLDASIPDSLHALAAGRMDSLIAGVNRMEDAAAFLDRFGASDYAPSMRSRLEATAHTALREARKLEGVDQPQEALDAYHRILFLAPDSRAATEARERIDFLVRSG
jgi:predicted Zn-dependent protease